MLRFFRRPVARVVVNTATVLASATAGKAFFAIGTSASGFAKEKIAYCKNNSLLKPHCENDQVIVSKLNQS